MKIFSFIHKREKQEEVKTQTSPASEPVKTEPAKEEAVKEETVKKTDVPKNNITEIVFILDRSGSMAGCEDDTIGGFNANIEKQRTAEGLSDRPAYVTTVLFDNESSVIHDRVPLNEIKTMTREDYQVGGCTALLDAVGETIDHIKSVHKYARPEDVPANTVFIITTDGMENASHKYSGKTVKSMIEEQQKLGWEFIFLGANIDAVETAESMGIKRSRAANYRTSSRGIGRSFEAMGDVLYCMRMDEDLDEHRDVLEKLKDLDNDDTDESIY